MSEVVVQQPDCPNPHQAGPLPGHTRHVAAVPMLLVKKTVQIQGGSERVFREPNATEGSGIVLLNLRRSYHLVIHPKSQMQPRMRL